jgi:hypothetical protein
MNNADNTIKTKQYQFDNREEALKFIRVARLTVDERRTAIVEDEFVCGIIEVTIDGALAGDIAVLDAFRKNQER